MYKSTANHTKVNFFQ